MADLWYQTGYYVYGKSTRKWNSGRSVCNDRKWQKYSLEPGDHGTTYGGNPLACTAVSKTIEIFEKKHLVAHVQEVGAYLTEKLEELDGRM